MAKPYSMDLRERAMRRVAAGESAHSVAVVLKVSVSSVIKWAQRQRRDIPEQDQGYLISVVQLPPGATLDRTEKVVPTPT